MHPAGARRHSFSSFAEGLKEHRHQNIPTCESSHPDNPIPTEPWSFLHGKMEKTARTHPVKVADSRNSTDDLGLTDNEASTSDSDAPSTPPTEPLSHVDNVATKIRSLSLSGAHDNSRPPKPRRASTTYASTTEDLRNLIGKRNGTQFLQRYCCGEGCCMIEALPLHADDVVFDPIVPPDNDAYRFLNLNLRSLSMTTPLTKIIELPEQRVSFGPLRRQSIYEKFPLEAQHRHEAADVQAHPPEYMKPHPPYSIFNAPVYGARELTKPGAEKRTFHFDIDVTDYPEEGGVDFKVGGAVGVCPPNDPDVVEDIMNQLGIPRFQRDKPVRVLTTSGRWPTIWGDDEPRELVTTRREILTWTVDISSSAPTKLLYRVLAEYAEDTNEKQILLYLSSAQGQAAFCDLRTGAHITLQQLLHAFPSAKPPLEAICNVLNQLMPRFYSLSNDPHVSSAREGLAGRRLIEMAVTVHSTPAFTGTTRTGVGSGFLERIAHKFIEAENKANDQCAARGYCLHPGETGRTLGLHVPMFRGLMANPLSREFASDGPMVLIGAGVGMAPFRGFILNRLKNANCANKIWLIQGIRDSKLDELYRGELGDHEHEIKKIVQSRAQPVPMPPVAEEGVPTTDEDEAALPGVTASDANAQNKVAKYVQDEVRFQADVVWFVINAIDGRIFVCGSTKGMGEGVEQALIDVAMDKGHLDFETAKQFWQDKKDAGQYIAETW